MSSDEKEKGQTLRQAQGKFAAREEEILKRWSQERVFEQTLRKEAPRGEFVFYDGPPFATGLPHYGHLVPTFIKDVIPRYKTMRGFHVPRKWGWDCHGLPVENLVEQELGLSAKKDIEEYGVAKFNEACRASVMRYADEWRRIIPRLGRWVDMDNDYRTMDTGFTESVWWVFKTLYDKGFIYEGFKSMHLCPRCETTLSNFEVSQGYKDVTDISVTVKFRVSTSSRQEEGSREPAGDSEIPRKLGMTGGAPTYLLAWTTTPWTLPGNAALAVNKTVVYGKFQITNSKSQTSNNFEKGEVLVVAKERAGEVLEGYEYEELGELKGEELVGLEYEPVFDYYKNSTTPQSPPRKGGEGDLSNAWKVYAADFVSTEDGTGIVHIAPAFGEDDMNLAQKEGVPMIQHVSRDGAFKDEVRDFAGMQVKPKEDPQSTDIEIIKYLAHQGLLFKKEKVTHSYPHCWRCDTPLLNYAASSWFVKVTDFKDKLVEENRRVGWVPPAIGEHRFHDWLENARDWAISRSRYWGAPLPVWENADGSKRAVIGSVQDLNANRKPRNKFIVMRHGESESNVQGVASTHVENEDHITEKGKEQIKEAAGKLKEQGGIDLIFTSDFKRTQESADLLAEELGLSGEAVIPEERVRETYLGVFEGKPVDEYRKYYDRPEGRFTKKIEDTETLNEVKKRVGDFLYETDKKYEGKRILIMTHGSPSWSILSAAFGSTPEEAAELLSGDDDKTMSNAEFREFDFLPLPHNENYELDLHRPYIDDFEYVDADGERLTRVEEVFDCWFESGSMPYGSHEYKSKAESRKSEVEFDPERNIGFPADFIAEGLDQTRGWFYSMMVLSTALFDQSAYRNVVVNGTVLAEDGKKMSKRLKNYPDLMEVVHKYGADPLRYYILTSSVVQADTLNFSETGVDEVAKKVLGRLDNVVSFYETYAKIPNSQFPISNETSNSKYQSINVLDRWMVARLNELIGKVTAHLDSYELDRAARPIGEFVDDLSVWYLRRSRERFKGDDENDKRAAISTTRYVLEEFSKVAAPFMPFIAEDVYQRISNFQFPISNEMSKKSKSVHLEDWPEGGEVDRDVLAQMAEVRRVVSLGLEKRSEAKIKVRQPLAKLKVSSSNDQFSMNEELAELIKDEVNVKEVVVDESIEGDVELDTEITPELRAEGNTRELIRAVQDARKKAGLSPSDSIELVLSTDNAGKELVEQYVDTIKRATGACGITFGEAEGDIDIEIDGMSFSVKLIK